MDPEEELVVPKMMVGGELRAMLQQRLREELSLEAGGADVDAAQCEVEFAKWSSFFGNKILRALH